jgi:hypothetical protein
MAEELNIPSEFKEKIKSSIKRSRALDSFLTKGELAGFDVKAAKEKNQADRDRLNRIKQTFFPNE